MFKGLLILAGAVLISQAAMAEEMLYSNSGYDFTCCSTASDLDIPLQIADGFVVGGSGTYTVTRVYWTGLYGGGSTPNIDDFTLRFYGDAAGRPEVSPLISLHAGNSASRLDWGNQRYTYSLDIAPLTLYAGEQYYLSILADTAGWDANWTWYAVDFPAGVGAGSNMLSFGRFQNAEGFAAALA